MKYKNYIIGVFLPVALASQVISFVYAGHEKEFGLTKKQPIWVGETIERTEYIPMNCLECEPTELSYIYKGIVDGNILVEGKITKKGAYVLPEEHFKYPLSNKNRAVGKLVYGIYVFSVVDKNNRITVQPFVRHHYESLHGTEGFRVTLPRADFDEVKKDREMSDKYVKMTHLNEGGLYYISREDADLQSPDEWKLVPFIYEKGSEITYKKYGYVKMINTGGFLCHVNKKSVDFALERNWKIAEP